MRRKRRHFGLTLLFSLPGGLILSFGSMSRFAPLKWLVKVFVWIIRGTPLMLQLVIIYFGPGLLVTWAGRAGVDNFFIDWMAALNSMDAMVSAVLAFSINYTCYFSEIYRGGIESVSRGQYEAGQVLGMTKQQIFFKIVLLQVIKRIMAPISNEVITLVKDTSMAFTVAYQEMFSIGKQIANSQASFMPFVIAGVFYYIMNSVVAFVMSFIEKRLNYYR